MTINHAGLIQRADHKETRMRMRPACILDGEILGEAFSGGEAMLDINWSPSLVLILWDSHHHWQCLFGFTIMKMDHGDICMGSQCTKHPQIFFHMPGLAIIMPGAGGQVGHLHTEKTSGLMLFMASPQMYVRFCGRCLSAMAVLTSIACPNTYFEQYIL